MWRSLERHDEVHASAELALDAALAAGLADVQADALVTLGSLAEAEGDTATAIAHFRRARDLASAGGHLLAEIRAAYNVVAYAFYAGDLEAASVEASLAVDRASELGLAWNAFGYSVRGLQAVILYTRGDLDGSTMVATSQVGGAAEPTRESLAAIGLYAAVARGDAGAADQALRMSDLDGIDPMARMIAAGTGSDALRLAGRPADASRVAAAGAARIAAVWGEFSLGGIWLAALGIAAEADLAVAARVRRDTAAEAAAVEVATTWQQTAQQTAARGRPRGGRLGPEGRAWLLRCAAELSRARGDSDAVLWRSVVAEFDYGYPYEVARSRWRLAEALVATADRAAAGIELRAAAFVAVELGAVPLQRDVADLARRARLDLGASLRVGRVPVAALTPRELEVLRLAPRGSPTGRWGSGCS